MHLIWKGFLTRIETDQGDVQEDEDNTMQCVNLKEEISEDNLNATLIDTPGVKLAEFLSEYLQHLRNGDGSFVLDAAHRGSYMSAYALLNLLNELKKRDKCEACRAFYFFITISFIKSIS